MVHDRAKLTIRQFRKPCGDFVPPRRTEVLTGNPGGSRFVKSQLGVRRHALVSV